MLNFARIAEECGYGYTAHIQRKEEIAVHIHTMLGNNKSSFLEIKCKRGARAELGRPTRTLAEIKTSFMKLFLEKKGD